MAQSNPTLADAQRRLDRLEQYLAVDPDNLALLTDAIDAALAASDLPAAHRHLARARELAPQDSFILARGGQVLLAERRWDDAAQLFMGLLSDHADVNLAYNAAFARFQLGEYEQAAAILLPFAEQCMPLAMVLLLRALHRAHQLERAIELIARHQDRMAKDSQFLAVASLVYTDASDLRQARQFSERAFATGARPIEALVSSGSFFLGEGDQEQARTLFEEALSVNPREGRSWAGLGVASLLAGEFSEGAAQFARALEYMPEHIGSWHGRGWCLLMAGDLVQAEAAFRQALLLDRNFGDSHGALAVIAALKQDRQTAQAAIDRALGLDPKGLAARYAQMILAGQTTDPERFRSLALRLLAARTSPTGRSLQQMVQEHAAR